MTVAKPGDPVLLSFAFCNKCDTCKAGHHSHCPEFTELNFGDVSRSFGLKSKGGEPNIGGGFFGQSSFGSVSIVRECSVVNAKDIITDKKDLQLFAPLGCGVQTGSGTVINAAKATPDDIVCVMGLGGVGLSAVMGAKIQGCRMIISVDKVKSRLNLATEFGATHAIDGSKLPEGKELVDVIKEIAEGQGPTITIDTTGAPALINAGVQFTRNRGKIIQVGSPPCTRSSQIRFVLERSANPFGRLYQSISSWRSTHSSSCFQASNSLVPSKDKPILLNTCQK